MVYVGFRTTPGGGGDSARDAVLGRWNECGPIGGVFTGGVFAGSAFAADAFLTNSGAGFTGGSSGMYPRVDSEDAEMGVLALEEAAVVGRVSESMDAESAIE